MVRPVQYLTYLKSLARRLWARTSRSTPRISASLSQPLLGGELDLAVQLIARVLAMYEITETTTDTALTTIKATAGLAEVGDRRELAVDGARSIPAGVKGVAGFLSGVFVLEACVDVAD
jgi:hypothetical protein